MCCVALSCGANYDKNHYHDHYHDDHYHDEEDNYNNKDEEYYKSSPSTNPKGPEGGQERVVRGGSYMENRAGLRATHRDGVTEVTTRDTIGFRIAMNADGTVPC